MEIFFPRIAEGRKAGRASDKKTAPPPPLAQGLDLPLISVLKNTNQPYS